MNMPAGQMQSLQMLQAALQASATPVSPVTMSGTSAAAVNFANASQPGGSTTSRTGNKLGGLIAGQRMPGGIEPTKNQLELALLGGTMPQSQDFLDAQDEYEIAKRKYGHTQDTRFRGQIGLGEKVFDLVRGKGAHKEMLEARQNVVNAGFDHIKAQETRMVEAEMQRRKQRHADAMVVAINNNPDSPQPYLNALAMQYATDPGMSIKDFASISSGGGADWDTKVQWAGEIYDDAKKMIDGITVNRRNMGTWDAIAEKGWKGQGAGQVALLYSFIRGLDPTSVVREGEVKLATAAESVINNWMRKYENVSENTIMSKVMYDDVLQLTKDLNDITYASWAQEYKIHSERADIRKVPRALVFGQSFDKEMTAAIADIEAHKAAKKQPDGDMILTRPAAAPTNADQMIDMDKYLEEYGTKEEDSGN